MNITRAPHMLRKESNAPAPRGNRAKRLFGRAATEKKLPNPATTKPRSWHAVRIVAKANSCDAARALLKMRYLSKDAPALPLESCVQGFRCPCIYKHHEDRRDQPRRDAETGLSGRSKKIDGERRVSRGRRREDL
jgi:hypothetical protein